MKISVSLSEADVRVLDEYAAAEGLPSRSAAVHRAVELLRSAELEDDYAAAFAEWNASGEEAAWEVAAADGVVDAAR
jgi:Arc/MetJ-type ribon-helix-helix transcriptional regulator